MAPHSQRLATIPSTDGGAGPIGLIHSLLGKPKQVRFGSVKLAPERFQVRDFKAGSYVQSILKQQESQQLSASLAQLVCDGVILDPIVIWRDPEGQLWVIDGHHRTEALQESETSQDTLIWTQEFLGATEGEARNFALDLNRRLHLNMHPKEAAEAYWKMLLAGEVMGSSRQRVRRYQVSKGTIARMDKQKPAVLATIQLQAAAEGVLMDAAYIRAHAPTWKGLEQWQVGYEAADQTALNLKAVEKVMRSLVIRFGDDVKAQPDVVLQAFEKFFEEATGEAISIQRSPADDFDEEF